MKLFEIYGYDSNYELGGRHTLPLISRVLADDENQARKYAEKLPRFKSYWSEGVIHEIKFNDIRKRKD